MLKCIKQFFRALFFKVKKQDIDYFEDYLNVGEKALFGQLSDFEKMHAILTAKQIKRLIHGKRNINEKEMVKAALLHDIGRIAAKISLFDKVWLKLLKCFMFPLYWRLAEESCKPGSRFKKFYVHQSNSKNYQK